MGVISPAAPPGVTLGMSEVERSVNGVKTAGNTDKVGMAIQFVFSPDKNS